MLSLCRACGTEIGKVQCATCKEITACGSCGACTACAGALDETSLHPPSDAIIEEAQHGVPAAARSEQALDELGKLPRKATTLSSLQASSWLLSDSSPFLTSRDDLWKQPRMATTLTSLTASSWLLSESPHQDTDAVDLAEAADDEAADETTATSELQNRAPLRQKEPAASTSSEEEDPAALAAWPPCWDIPGEEDSGACAADDEELEPRRSSGACCGRWQEHRRKQQRRTPAERQRSRAASESSLALSRRWLLDLEADGISHNARRSLSTGGSPISIELERPSMRKAATGSPRRRRRGRSHRQARGSLSWPRLVPAAEWGQEKGPGAPDEVIDDGWWNVFASVIAGI